MHLLFLVPPARKAAIYLLGYMYLLHTITWYLSALGGAYYTISSAGCRSIRVSVRPNDIQISTNAKYGMILYHKRYFTFLDTACIYCLP